MNKACNGLCNCPYKTISSSSIRFMCSFYGYCDYQAPRDSRNIKLEGDEYKNQ